MGGIDPQTISTFALFAALTVTTIGTRLSAKGRKSTKERNQLRQLVEDCIELIHRQSIAMIEAGLPRIELPKSLKEYMKGEEEE